MKIAHYTIHCSTEGLWKDHYLPEGDPEPTTCPTDTGHTVTPDSVSVVETIGPDEVTVTNQPVVRGDGVAYAVPKPSTFGMEMCDRDFRINTCLVDGAASLEDWKVNTSTNKEEDWNELTLVGVYRDDAGAMVLCADQVEADAGGILSVWDYTARISGAQIPFEIRDGLLYVDPAMPANERWDHRAYSVVAPGIPAAYGGSVAVFDGYLGAAPNGVIEALSPQTSILDPAGPGGLPGAIIRIYIFHPVAAKLSHVLRLVTYRAPGTF